MTTLLDQPAIIRVALERKLRQVCAHIPNTTIHLENPPIMPRMMDGVVVRMAQELLAKKSGELVKEHFEYPADWWQHLRKRLGLKYKTASVPVVIEHWNVCPHLPIPESGQRVHFDMLTSPNGAWLNKFGDQ